MDIEELYHSLLETVSSIGAPTPNLGSVIADIGHMQGKDDDKPGPPDTLTADTANPTSVTIDDSVRPSAEVVEQLPTLLITDAPPPSLPPPPKTLPTKERSPIRAVPARA